MKLEETKYLQNVFKSNFKTKYQKEDLNQNSKNVHQKILLYKSQETVIRLFGYYFSIVLDAKCKSIHGERLKILTPKKILKDCPECLHN